MVGGACLTKGVGEVREVIRHGEYHACTCMYMYMDWMGISLVPRSMSVFHFSYM